MSVFRRIKDYLYTDNNYNLWKIIVAFTYGKTL